jgi:hypothetical protein
MTTSSLIQAARVWLRRGSLDRSLAAGADPGTSPELARRARQPRGIALIEQLLTHGDSPVYMCSPEGGLREALRQARAALYLG